jgi:SAM-dependent methyltransferase
MSTKLLQTVIDQEQDFEWYPTDSRMLKVVHRDIMKVFPVARGLSLLDCGAGNGKVFDVLTKLDREANPDNERVRLLADKYAIEKSRPLIDAMPKDIFMVGVEFFENTLMDKKVDVVFSNPPYRQYTEFSEKIIAEANARIIYLIIPSRWKVNYRILNAIELRGAKYKVLDSFTFEKAETRQARAKVDIVRVSLDHIDQDGSLSLHTGNKVDPFEAWFKEEFGDFTKEKEEPDYRKKATYAKTLKEKTENALVEGTGLIEALENLYEQEMDHLAKNYKSLSELDPDLLKVMDISLEAVREGLKQKIEGTKNVYWRELFSNLDKITNRLTQKSRREMLDTLFKHTHVDFNTSNVYAIVQWAIKNANQYFDDQLIQVYSQLIGKANIELYKSNQRILKDFDWGYLSIRVPKDLDRFKLDYRIVAHRTGGISNQWDAINGLSPYATALIDDLVTIGNNLGFECEQKTQDYQWETGKKHLFSYRELKTGKEGTLFEVKAFLNGNLHFRMGQKFIRALNIEHGRLKEITPLQLNNQIH